MWNNSTLETASVNSDLIADDAVIVAEAVDATGVIGVIDAEVEEGVLDTAGINSWVENE
jgi:hypothetical protein